MSCFTMLLHPPPTDNIWVVMTVCRLQDQTGSEDYQNYSCNCSTLMNSKWTIVFSVFEMPGQWRAVDLSVAWGNSCRRLSPYLSSSSEARAVGNNGCWDRRTTMVSFITEPSRHAPVPYRPTCTQASVRHFLRMIDGTLPMAMIT